MERPIIQFYNVFKKFGANQVLRGVSLRIFQGQVTTIIGKSGGGKSVLLKHIIGLMQPDSGNIYINGESLATMKNIQRRQLRRRFSYMFQDAALFALRAGAEAEAAVAAPFRRRHAIAAPIPPTAAIDRSAAKARRSAGGNPASASRSSTAPVLVVLAAPTTQNGWRPAERSSAISAFKARRSILSWSSTGA